jgi:hypothetical protein
VSCVHGPTGLLCPAGQLELRLTQLICESEQGRPSTLSSSQRCPLGSSDSTQLRQQLQGVSAASFVALLGHIKAPTRQADQRTTSYPPHLNTNTLCPCYTNHQGQGASSPPARSCCSSGSPRPASLQQSHLYSLVSIVCCQGKWPAGEWPAADTELPLCNCSNSMPSSSGMRKLPSQRVG